MDGSCYCHSIASWLHKRRGQCGGWKGGGGKGGRHKARDGGGRKKLIGRQWGDSRKDSSQHLGGPRLLVGGLELPQSLL